MNLCNLSNLRLFFLFVHSWIAHPRASTMAFSIFILKTAGFEDFRRGFKRIKITQRIFP